MTTSYLSQLMLHKSLVRPVLVPAKDIICSPITTDHHQTTSFQRVPLDNLFNTDGFSLSLGWFTANSGFCLPCVLFAVNGYRGSNPGVLVSRPLKDFKKALEKLRKHPKTEHHKAAVASATEFQRSMSNQQADIQQRLSKSHRIANNRQKLESIIKTIILCGRQNIALRGHRDNALDIERDAAGLQNHGSN